MVMRVLITGGCGFIGTNLVEFLLEKSDFDIRVLDNLSEGKLEDLKSVKGYDDKRIGFVKKDIRDKDARDDLKDCGMVVNLAAQTGVVPSVDDPLTDHDINVGGVLNMLEAAKEFGVMRFVQASSAAPLGEQEMPLDETKVPMPMSPYGASKLACEGYCSAFSASYDFCTVVLRFSNVYGPRSYAKGSVVPKFIRRIKQGKQLTVFGDGKQTRDFVFVRDICNAIYLALLSELKGYNLIQIGTGVETSINELIELLKKEMHKLEVVHAEARKGEIYRNYTDISKASRILGYKPEINLREGLKLTIQSFN